MKTKNSKIIIIVLFAILSSQLSISQTFTELTTANLPGISSGSVSWGDYDNDGDLDILLTGADLSSGVTEIYRNDAGSFVDINSGIINLSESSASWGDYDNDGDLDILIIGRDSTMNAVTKIYRNDSGTFTDINAILPKYYRGCARWGDYDNDGDLDFLLMGKVGASFSTAIYKNNSSVFTIISAGITGLNYGEAEWGDYDNDGDLDILVSGDANNTPITKIYRNDSASFTDINANLYGLSYSSACWGDYDNDGDLDILITGWHTGLNNSRIYRNDAGTFVDISAPIIGVQHGSAKWADYDNDGDLDIIVTGEYSGNSITNYYKNNAGTYTYVNAGIEGVSFSSIAPGDYDNDGDLDIVFMGISTTTPIAKIYKNNSTISNTPPSAPANLNATVDLAKDVTLSWDKSTDSQTNQNSLTYNISLGISPGGIQNVSPMANVSTGYRKIVSYGNTFHNNSWTIKDLTSGIYYWSVQAIDNAFAGSAFSVQDSFEIDCNSIEENLKTLEYLIYPNPAQSNIYLQFKEKHQTQLSLKIYNSLGVLVKQEKLSLNKKEYSINIENLESGVYFISILSDNKNALSSKFVKM